MFDKAHQMISERKKKVKGTPATAAPERQLVCLLPGPRLDAGITSYTKKHGRDFRVDFIPTQSLKL